MVPPLGHQKREEEKAEQCSRSRRTRNSDQCPSSGSAERVAEDAQGVADGIREWKRKKGGYHTRGGTPSASPCPACSIAPGSGLVLRAFLEDVRELGLEFFQARDGYRTDVAVVWVELLVVLMVILADPEFLKRINFCSDFLWSELFIQCSNLIVDNLFLLLVLVENDGAILRAVVWP